MRPLSTGRQFGGLPTGERVVTGRRSVVAQVPAFAIALVMMAACVACLFSDFRELAHRWLSDPGESHGALIAAMVPALVWLRRARVGATRRGRVAAALACLLAIAMLMICRSASIDAAAWLIVPVIAACSIAVALGFEAARELAGPIAYFWLALPMWTIAAPPFQWLTVKATTAVLGLVRVPLIVSGNVVRVPAGTFEIAEGCSGIRFLVVTLALAFMVSMVSGLSRRRVAALVAAAVGTALVANWIRVATIVYIGEATKMRSPLVADHYALGWWMFAVALVPLGWYAAKIVGAEPPRANADLPSHRPTPWPAIVSGCCLLGVAPLWTFVVEHASSDRTLALALPNIATWAGPADGSDGWRPRYPGAEAERLVTYRNGASTVAVYVAAYDRQSRSGKLIGYGSSLTGEGWADEAAPPATFVGPHDSPIGERLLADPWGAHRVLWFWYEVEGERIVSPVRVKFREGLGAFGVGRRSAVVALSATCTPTCDAAREALHAAYAAGLESVGLNLEAPHRAGDH